MKNKKGISLIVLIITIIVVIILAATVIFALTENNPVNSAKEAAFKSDIRNFQDSLAMYVGKQLVTDDYGNREKITVIDNLDDMDKYISEYNKKKYSDKLGIEDDELVYFQDKVTKDEKKWLEDLGIKPYGNDIKEADEGIFKWDENDDTKIIGYNEKEFNEYLSTNKGVLKIPEKCKSIGKYAFSDCDNIKSVIVPDSVINMYDGAFRNCTKISEIKLSDNIEIIWSSSFFNCSSLKKISLPSKCNKIYDQAFYACTNLVSVEFPNNLSYISDRAFYNCSSLVDITIPDDVKIGSSSFIHCKGLLKVELGERVSIGSYAFSDCVNLKEIIIPESVSIIGGGALTDTLWYKNMPDGIVYINNTLYKYKGSIPVGMTITINNNVNRISSYAFMGQENLTSISIPNGVTYIGDDSFSGCTGLKNIVIPESVTYIGDYNFYGCTNLEEVTISSSVKTIGISVFNGCVNLTSIKYTGTISEWKNISNNNWNTVSRIQKVICTDGEIEI